MVAGTVHNYVSPPRPVVVTTDEPTNLGVQAKNKNGHFIPLPERLEVTSVTVKPVAATCALGTVPQVTATARYDRTTSSILITASMAPVEVDAPGYNDGSTWLAVTPGRYTVHLTFNDGCQPDPIPVYVWPRPRGVVNEASETESTEMFAIFNNGMTLQAGSLCLSTASAEGECSQVVRWAPPGTDCYMVWQPTAAAHGDGPAASLRFHMPDAAVPVPGLVPVCPDEELPLGLWGCGDGLEFNLPDLQVQRDLHPSDTTHPGELCVVVRNPVHVSADGVDEGSGAPGAGAGAGHDGGAALANKGQQSVGDWGSDAVWWRWTIGQRPSKVRPAYERLAAKIVVVVRPTTDAARVAVKGTGTTFESDSTMQVRPSSAHGAPGAPNNTHRVH